MLTAREWTGEDAIVLCKALHMTEVRFARMLGVSPRTISHWVSHPQTKPRAFARDKLDELYAEVPAEIRATLDGNNGISGAQRPDPENKPGPALLGQVPQGFPATALTGLWVTSYQFLHNGVLQHHADIAHVQAESDQQLRVMNHPPEPRTEGRATPFHNAIEARLINRHFIGHWKNTSDTRYFGTVHLAVLPGEMMMEGYYTGFASDILVSTAPWKWVRLQASDADLKTVMLRDPAFVYDAVMSHQYDVPIALSGIREDT